MKWSELSENERDALVAEKVMGWEQVMPFEVYQRYLWKREDAPGLTRDTLPFSRSIDAACMIPVHPSFFGANTEIMCVPKGYWRCCVDFHEQGKEYHGFADTPSEAVCIAFLRAVGVEIETGEEKQ